jgi:MoxR-like ATPase
MTPETELPRWLAPVDLESNGPFHRIHQFEERDVWAIWAAKAAGRPLLVRGEPGLGKTQLAQAAAKLLERDLITHTVDARTETRDLLYSFRPSVTHGRTPMHA